MSLVKKNEKTKKVASGWQRGAGTLFLCLKATGETKEKDFPSEEKLHP
jgi:hypothetical protein